MSMPRQAYAGLGVEPGREGSFADPVQDDLLPKTSTRWADDDDYDDEAFPT